MLNLEKIKKPELNVEKNLVFCIFYRYNKNGEIEIITENRIPNQIGEQTAKLPGGGVEGAETEVKAIIREIHEELNFDLNKIDFQELGEVVFELSDMINPLKHMPNQYAKSTVFSAFYPIEILPQAPINDDIDSFMWLSISEFRNRSRRKSYLYALDLFERKLLLIQMRDQFLIIKDQFKKYIFTSISLINQIP